jgi:pyruvate/2-oxoacid:ferredoxin oxidoreductase alpha subunit
MKRVMTGNQAVAYGVILSRVEVISAYPITPQNEIPAYMARRMPEEGRIFKDTHILPRLSEAFCRWRSGTA